VVDQYAAVMDLWMTIKPLMQPRYVELRYEDTVRDIQGSMKEVFALLALSWNEEISRFHEQAKTRFIATPSFADVAKPIYQNASGRWRHYRKFLEPVASKLRPYLHSFGYEK
jgi:hypothetical protein